jgi:hypothetical protein
VSTLAVAGTHLLWVVVVTVFAAIPLGLSAWAFLDSAHRPSWAWALSRHRQVAWLVAIVFGVMLVPLGLGISLWYLLKVRPAVAAAERGDVAP